jgi:hypothetical protein
MNISKRVHLGVPRGAGLHLARASCDLRSWRLGCHRVLHRPAATERSVRRTVAHLPNRARHLRRPASQQHVEARPGHVCLSGAPSPQCRGVRRVWHASGADDRAVCPRGRVVGASDLDDDRRWMGRPSCHARRAHRPCLCHWSAPGSLSDLHPDHAGHHSRRADACGRAAGTSDRHRHRSHAPAAQARSPSGTAVGGRLRKGRPDAAAVPPVPSRRAQTTRTMDATIAQILETVTGAGVWIDIDRSCSGIKETRPP